MSDVIWGVRTLFRIGSCYKTADEKTHKRRMDLKSFVLNSRTENNRCKRLFAIVKHAVALVSSLPENQADALIGDLEAVIIGANMTNCRGKGPYFADIAHINILGASGFKKELRDPYYQIQHAVAGIVIGYRGGWIAERVALWRESEEQDVLLYRATFPLGRELNDENLTGLPGRIKQAIGDESCRT